MSEPTLSVDQLAARLFEQFGKDREFVEQTLDKEFIPSHGGGEDRRVFVRDVEEYEDGMRRFLAKCAEIKARYHKPDDDVLTTAEKIVESEAQTLIHVVRSDPDESSVELLEELIHNGKAVSTAEAVVADAWNQLEDKT